MKRPRARREGFLYLLLPGDIGLRAVKVGRTDNLRQRIRSYPPGSRYLCVSICLADCIVAELGLIRHFRTLYRLARGREYFEADPDEARIEFIRYLNALFGRLWAESQEGPGGAEPMDCD